MHDLPRSRPVKDRPGKAAWFGPLSFGLALLSWLVPVGSPGVAAVAVTLGLLSTATDRVYRLDWTAVAGWVVGAAQLAFSLLLLVMELTGH
ncbi:hypothetical protein ACFFSW_12990 [Saccharothrix longispora]|uniref:SPW repeat-containing protein n=1 Tax=Saccharothrix longispora TaxID=33920 RepID=A0ABU1PPP6_9PSEU|nr:hypothetical protein [Saccharothrix longispora]MDR6592431.1 hypothetical protein [Saccharothrix longispora]